LPTPPSPQAVDLMVRLDRIQKLVDELARVQDDAIEQQSLSERIHREILAARRDLLPIKRVD
jgi:hypothetical protein